MEKEGEEKETRVEAMMEYSSEYYTFYNNMFLVLENKSQTDFLSLQNKLFWGQKKWTKHSSISSPNQMLQFFEHSL